ncbi:MAG: single-stranded DNA-binding protein [Clostridiales bacterium]|nr:single-stranded DNA-binding protein [Clostridiales bacterium]
MGANFNFNKVVLGGRLTADPELKTTPSGLTVTNFTLAVTRSKRGDKEPVTDFINIVAWRKLAEFITKFFHKGTSICILGELQTRTYEDDHGTKHFIVEVLAQEATFVEAKNEASNFGAPQVPTPSYMPETYTAQPAPKFEEITEEDDLPF